MSGERNEPGARASPGPNSDDRWGDPIDAERQSELRALADRQRAGPLAHHRIAGRAHWRACGFLGPMSSGWRPTPLSGLMVTWLWHVLPCLQPWRSPTRAVRSIFRPST
jgi:hypothetical protein